MPSEAVERYLDKVRPLATVVVFLLVVGGCALVGFTLAGVLFAPLEDAFDTTYEVQTYTVTEGEGIVDDVWRTGGDVHVALNGTASDHGIASASLYHNGEEWTYTNLRPGQERVYLQTPIGVGQDRFVLYDGSNRVVADVTVSYAEREGEDA